MHDGIIYYYDQNPSGFSFLVQITAFVIKISLGLPNLNMKRKTKKILVIVIKWCHHANGLLKCDRAWKKNKHPNQSNWFEKSLSKSFFQALVWLFKWKPRSALSGTLFSTLNNEVLNLFACEWNPTYMAYLDYNTIINNKKIFSEIPKKMGWYTLGVATVARRKSCKTEFLCTL